MGVRLPIAPMAELCCSSGCPQVDSNSAINSLINSTTYLYPNHAMIFSRRTKRHPPVLAACMILALLWLFNDKVANHDHSFTNTEVSSTASSKPEFMDAKPQMEDKAVVIGKLSSENTSWVVELQK